MPMTTRLRSLPWLALSAVVVAVSVWAVLAQSSTSRPANEEADIFAGAPDPTASRAEEQLAWALEVIDGRPVSADELEARFSAGFLEQISLRMFLDATAVIVDDGPYRFYGFDSDPELGVAAALIVDASDVTFVLTLTQEPQEPDKLAGLLVAPVDVDSGPFPLPHFALHLLAGLVLFVAGALVAHGGRRPALGWILAGAGLLWLLQLLELSEVDVAYTLGLLVGPVAAVGVVLALVTAPTGRVASPAAWLVVGAAATAAVAAILPTLAVDTEALSLPTNLAFVGEDGDRARQFVRVSGALTAVAALGLAAFALVRQFRVGWSRSPALVPSTAATVVAAAVAAVPAVSAAVGQDGYDLSFSPVLAVAAMVAAVGIGGTALALESEQLLAVQASRVRILRAGEEARRQLERDLHDGAQQRLLAVLLSLRMGRDRFGRTDPEVDAYLAQVADDLGEAVSELRELSRGLHPAILDQGVVAAAESLAEASSVPTTVIGDASLRYPDPVEHAAYFVISEALTNATRHAEASHVEVRIEGCDDDLRVAVTDDGCGGATIGDGSGLQNLEDRVLALAGSWHLDSAPGRGTAIEVVFPCG